jgi:hypothetical protein
MNPMNGETNPGPVALTADAARSYLAAAPSWARAMVPRREADGRVVLVGEADGCYLWVQPKAWSPMTVKPADAHAGDAAGALNYGLQMEGIASHRGQIETNDSTFGRAVLGARAGAEHPLPADAPGPALLPTVPLILAASLVLSALILRTRKAR